LSVQMFRKCENTYLRQEYSLFLKINSFTTRVALKPFIC